VILHSWVLHTFTRGNYIPSRTWRAFIVTLPSTFSNILSHRGINNVCVCVINSISFIPVYHQSLQAPAGIHTVLFQSDSHRSEETNEDWDWEKDAKCFPRTLPPKSSECVVFLKPTEATPGVLRCTFRPSDKSAMVQS
jgi:hypothetical protein